MLPRFAAIVSKTINIALFFTFISVLTIFNVNGTKIINATSFVINEEAKKVKKIITKLNDLSLSHLLSKKSLNASKALEDSKAAEMPIREKSNINTRKSIISKYVLLCGFRKIDNKVKINITRTVFVDMDNTLYIIHFLTPQEILELETNT